MGDRANIVLEYEDNSLKEMNDNVHQPRIYLYTHHDGHNLPMILKTALLRGESRWDDYSYLARIIFSEMIFASYAREALLDTTGFGISLDQGDNERTLIYVNLEDQCVSIGDGYWHFSEYIEAPESTIREYYK